MWIGFRLEKCTRPSKRKLPSESQSVFESSERRMSGVRILRDIWSCGEISQAVGILDWDRKWFVQRGKLQAGNLEDSDSKLGRLRSCRDPGNLVTIRDPNRIDVPIFKVFFSSRVPCVCRFSRSFGQAKACNCLALHGNYSTMTASIKAS